MIHVSQRHVKHLSAALEDILVRPQRGEVAFLRCLSSDLVDALIDAPEFIVDRWSIYAVVDKVGVRRVTADVAVEHREQKGDPTLFLIDPARAGAGLDGIYSAAREISESELFDAAKREASRGLRGKTPFLRFAERRARRLGRRRQLTPWEVFDFYIAVESEGPGAALSRLGLWPIAGQDLPDDRALDEAEAMSDRLFFAPDPRRVQDKIRGLLLDDPAGEAALERFLRGAADLTPAHAVATLQDKPALWLRALRPRFLGDDLTGLSIIPWKAARGGVAKWSGLTIDPAEPDGSPRLLLDQAAPAKQRSRLEVRWSANPDSLAKGAVEYRVTVLAGDEELAERSVIHRGPGAQKVVFTLDDFEHLVERGTFGAHVQVSAVGIENVQPALSTDFMLEIGTAEAMTAATSGSVMRTLSEGAIEIATRTAFEDAVRVGHLPPRIDEDKKGYISWRGDGNRASRVLRPALLKQVEDDWVARDGALGRWTMRVRSDGSPVGKPTFVPFGCVGVDSQSWERVVVAARKLAAEMGPFGSLARVLASKWPAADSYLNAFDGPIADGAVELALHGTIEVRSMGGKTVGLIVTPIHPVRLAWHCAYDQALAHARYEQGMSARDIHSELIGLDGALFPSALPGFGGRGFVFAEMLGFHAVAMTVDGEPEPKAAVSLLSGCLGSGSQATASSIGAESVSVLAREIRHYLACHQVEREGTATGISVLHVHAWQPGDAMTVARALGEVHQKAFQSMSEEAAEEESALCFSLDLLHAHSLGHTSGRFLANVARRRRSGGGVLEPQDRWMTTTVRRAGEIVVPRLRWARRDSSKTVQPAHIAIAFDVFSTSLETRPRSELGPTRPMHVFGLTKVCERRTEFSAVPEWTIFSPPELEGDKVPDNRAATERLLRIDNALQRATVRFLRGGVDDWPVLVTRLTADAQAHLQSLHARSDWVITVDRNACIEYFDAPNHLAGVYERFVIDAVPERGDLGALQIVTSTSHLDEVGDLVDETLGLMGLSGSERNSRFLLDQLKALSGRLAIRLASPTGHAGELVALALMHAHCAEREGGDATWLDLSQGFLVPADDIAEMPFLKRADPDAAQTRRADFIYVSAPGRGSLEFRFVEVKHRLHLRTARQSDLMRDMIDQCRALHDTWHGYFFDAKLKPLVRSIRRSQLARILRFYCARASRHQLVDLARQRIERELDHLLVKEQYQPNDSVAPFVGYVFCPEHHSGRPERLFAENGEQAELWLFGPGLLPDTRTPRGDQPALDLTRVTESAASHSPSPSLVAGSSAPMENGVSDQPPSTLQLTHSSDVDQTDVRMSVEAVIAPGRSGPAEISLGTTTANDDTVKWSVSIHGNPHIMIVGLPGMGKTTSLIHICRQLADAGITPIVFSYHDDIDTKLSDALGELNWVDYAGLGFNPLRLYSRQPTAYVDVAGTVRDIFASVFRDLGDLQLEELRQSIKQSYLDAGWGGLTTGDDADRAPPSFRAFFDILCSKTKPNATLIARLQELADYGFFDGATEGPSLLDATRPSVVRIHGTTNGILQNAFSSFVLYSLYQDMFRRGVQQRITHAVVIDEAHRAARLKLVPQFAKECRKFGLALALASQEAKDFNASLFAAVGSYLVLRVTDVDARGLAKMTGATADEKRTADRLKALDRYSALFFTEGRTRPVAVKLAGE